MENYIEEMDQILTSSSIQDYNRGIELAKIHLKWNGAGNDYENMLISSTYDIFIDSRTYWSENADAWAESMNIDSSDIEKILWRIARADGWALAKAVYKAGWYYATMFWKEMLIASGIASATSVLKGIKNIIRWEIINGQVVYSVGDESLTESEMEDYIIQEMVNQRPELGFVLE